MPSQFALLGFHIAVALAVFLGLNWLGRKSDVFGYETLTMFTEREDAVAFNFLFRAVTPVVLLILIAALCYSLEMGAYTKNLHYAIAYYILFRVGFNVARGRALLLPWGRLVVQWAVTLGLAMLTYKYLISKREYLFPDIGTISNEVWLAIAGYLYILADRVLTGDTSAERRGRRYVKNRRSMLERQFGHFLSSQLPSARWRSLVIALLLVEDFNRPALARWAERVLFRFGKAKTLGIMQVAADRVLSDSESVARGIEKLMTCYSTAVTDGNWRLNQMVDFGATRRHDLEEAQLIHNTLVLYNPSGDYARDVWSIFERLVSLDPQSASESLHPEYLPG